MLEYERKVMLTPNEYEFLKEYRYAAAKNVVQVNYYYDTDDFELSRKGITCRIREKNGICMATVKEHCIKGSDCSVENSKAVKNRYDDGIFGEMGLCCQGSLETFRSTYAPVSGIKIMLDRNVYLGTVDYELEIEYENACGKAVNAEFEQIIVQMLEEKILVNSDAFRTRIGHSKNKSARFFSRKAEFMRRTGGGSYAFCSK